MKLSTQPIKGARDFYPEDMRLQKYLFQVMRSVCERFGYEEYDAPILEPTDLYLSKGNEEIIQEQTYSFKDRGDRSLTLRTEMTPTVSRMVASRRQEAPYPLRWYSIPQCWRYERMQRGRGREFYQLNVDLFGVDGISADYEMIDIADNILKAYGADRSMYTIKLNSRKLVDGFLKTNLGFDDTQAQTAIRLIDRMAKIAYPEFVGLMDAICSPSQRDSGANERLLQFLKAQNMSEIPEEIRGSENAVKLIELIEKLKNSGISNAKFDPTLMRGFDYYTDITFEVFDTNPDNNRSMFGGGRYDGLVAMFGVDPVSSVGFAMGDITLKNFLESHDLLPKLKSKTDVSVILVGDIFDTAQKPIKQLREMGLNVAVDSTGRKADKQIKSVIRNSVRYVVFIGESELEENQYTLKDLVTGSAEKYSLERLVTVVKDFRNA